MKRYLFCVFLTIGLSTLFLLWKTGWLAIGYYWLALDDKRIDGVSHYKVAIEAKQISGVKKNASGLTYHIVRKTLFAVINNPPQVVEMTTDGRLLRTIPIQGLKDVEGISYITGDTFVLSDETDHLLIGVEIDDKATRIDFSDQPRLSLALDIVNNDGFEGVSWDNSNNRLFIVKEKNPIRIIEITGLCKLLESKHFDLKIAEWKPKRSLKLLMEDLSSLTYHEKSGHILLLSDESHLVVEFDEKGQPCDMMVLRAGWHGLKQKIPQAEGIAMTPEGTLFILSEPNLFYRFER